MCTRYALEKDLPELREIIDAALRSLLAQRFVDTHARPVITDGEVRPTDVVPVIAPDAKGRRAVFPMQWGFLATDNRRTLFNARMETAGERPTFRDAWRSHRCIIPASYYFEWQHLKNPDGRENRRQVCHPARRLHNHLAVRTVSHRERLSGLRRAHQGAHRGAF